MFKTLKAALTAKPAAPPIPQRERLIAQQWPAVVYAIGDVHGCITEMEALERKIIADGAAIEGERWIVYLGDYLDRGPNAAGVIDFLLASPPPGWTRLPIAGNHEVMALEFLNDPRPESRWLEFGGAETLASYGIPLSAMQRKSMHARQSVLHSHIPDEHVAFLRDLPIALSLPGCIFVHAGIRRGVPLAEQHDDDLLWIRHEFFDAPADPDLLVVHGHTPSSRPVVAEGRICVDTGAYATGVLSAVRLTSARQPTFLDTANIPPPALGNAVV